MRDPEPTCPSTAEHLARVAATAPTRIALVANGRIVTYAALSGAEIRAAAHVPRTTQGKIRREELRAALKARNTL